MTTPFEATTTNHEPNGDSSPVSIPQRKKLQLKPRSIPPPDDLKLLQQSPPARRRARCLSAKGDPFGDAVPREEVLSQRGIDPVLMDSRFDAKARHHEYTREQELELGTARTELTKIEEALREKNEKELPEEELRLVVEAKRLELRTLMAKFDEQNKVAANIPATSPWGLQRRRRRSVGDQQLQP